MSWLILKLIGLGVPAKAARPLIIGVGALLIVGAAFGAWKLWLHHHDRGVVEQHEAKVTAQLQMQARTADQHVEASKDAATIRQSEERKEFNDATASLPKSGLSDRQHIDACRELRRQGEPPALLARAKCV
jgi:hypothetical protein